MLNVLPDELLPYCRYVLILGMTDKNLPEMRLSPESGLLSLCFFKEDAHKALGMFASQESKDSQEAATLLKKKLDSMQGLFKKNIFSVMDTNVKGVVKLATESI